jgi:hypothetical protein
MSCDVVLGIGDWGLGAEHGAAQSAIKRLLTESAIQRIPCRAHEAAQPKAKRESRIPNP